MNIEHTKGLLTKATLAAGFFFLISVSPIVLETLKSTGNDPATSGFVNVLLVFVFILFFIPAILGALYYGSLYPEMSFEPLDYSIAEPHAITWAILIPVLWAARYIDFAGLARGGASVILAETYAWFASLKLGGKFDAEDMGLPRTPEARAKEVQRAKLAKELEETLAEQKKLEAKIKARSQKS